MGLLGIFEGKRKGQRVERWSACLPEYLNASTPERLNIDNSHDKHPEAPTSKKTTSTTSTKITGRGKFSTPGVVERRGGGVTPLITRGTKTGNKVLSLWKGGKRNGKRRKTNE